jgi:hypothetical protein
MFRDVQPSPDQISLWPLLQLDALNFVLVVPTLILTMSLPNKIPILSYIPSTLMIFNAFAMHRYVYSIVKKTSRSVRARRSTQLLVFVLALTYQFLIPTLLRSDEMMIGLLSFLWIPQII